VVSVKIICGSNLKNNQKILIYRSSCHHGIADTSAAE
jgi:hypothetical protein